MLDFLASKRKHANKKAASKAEAPKSQELGQNLDKAIKHALAFTRVNAPDIYRSIEYIGSMPLEKSFSTLVNILLIAVKNSSISQENFHQNIVTVGECSGTDSGTVYPAFEADESQATTSGSCCAPEGQDQQDNGPITNNTAIQGGVESYFIPDTLVSQKSKIQELECQIKCLQEEKNKSDRNHKHGFEVQKRQLDQSTDESTRLKEKLSKLEHDYQAERDASEAGHQREVDTFKRSYADLATENLTLKSQYQAERKKVDTKYEREVSILKREKEQNAQQAERDMTDVRNQHEKEVTALEKKHAEETGNLRKEIDAYSQELLRRDRLETLTDKELKAKFSDLAQDIENLARGKWKENQAQWTSEVMVNLSANQRLLGKHIIHDCIWMTLNEYLFMSPFRILGAEGRALEKDWLESCRNSKELVVDTNGYTWPTPSVATERWRYNTVKECREALKNPTSLYDARAKLKTGFRETKEDLRAQLATTLAELIVLDKSSLQAVDRLTMKAANMWLAFGTQRCRILLLFEGSKVKTVEEKIRVAKEGVLELVVEPKLTRIGNSKGQELHSTEVIRGCEGKIVKLHWASERQI